MDAKISFLTRGALARRAGVHAETVRFYEKRGLLAEPARDASNYREYPLSAVTRIRFIKRAQELGFTLREIEEMLKLSANSPNPNVKGLAITKLEVIDGKIRDLLRMRNALAAFTDALNGIGSVSGCPIVSAMEEG
jgi:DNA-binding transcriptional MerR regulator